MTPNQFREWRQSLGLSKAAAARALGISVSRLLDYETGWKRGADRAAPIPRIVELACRALLMSAELFDARVLDDARGRQRTLTED